MPLVQLLPQGSNVGMVKGLSERTRSLEARRASIGVNMSGVPTDIEVTGWLPVDGGTTSVVLVGPSGAVWAMTGTEDIDSVVLGVSVDGGTPTNLPFSPVISGLTPGWHTFSIQIDGSFSFGITAVPWMIVWPL